MSVLVADVGGTNTRLAVLEPSGDMTPARRFANDKYASFEAVLEDFGPGYFSGSVIAIAGPVTRDRAQLTNRDWVFQRPEIARRLGVPKAENVILMNDLAALGHALPDFRKDQLSDIRPTAETGATNGQALVVGIGTGFNVALVKQSVSGPVVLEAELGHASPPASVSQALAAAWGDAAERFPTNEDVFSGRGLAELHQLLAGGALHSGPDILAGYQNDPAAAHTVDLLAEWLGLLAQQLTYMYLPFDGIYFAGGVARGILGSPARKHFLDKLRSPGLFADQTEKVAVRLVDDDAAALAGLARVAKNTGLLADQPD